jgi:hypothetical protein
MLAHTADEPVNSSLSAVDDRRRKSIRSAYRRRGIRGRKRRYLVAYAHTMRLKELLFEPNLAVLHCDRPVGRSDNQD